MGAGGRRFKSCRPDHVMAVAASISGAATGSQPGRYGVTTTVIGSDVTASEAAVATNFAVTANVPARANECDRVATPETAATLPTNTPSTRTTTVPVGLETVAVNTTGTLRATVD